MYSLWKKFYFFKYKIHKSMKWFCNILNKFLIHWADLKFVAAVMVIERCRYIHVHTCINNFDRVVSGKLQINKNFRQDKTLAELWRRIRYCKSKKIITILPYLVLKLTFNKSLSAYYTTLYLKPASLFNLFPFYLEQL